MKVLYKGHLYEYQTDLFLSDDEAKKKYDEHLEKLELENIKENEYETLEEELQSTNVKIPLLLKKYGIEANVVGSDYVYNYDNEYHVIRGREIYSIEDLIDNPTKYGDAFPEIANIENEMSEEFWKYPDTLYHATDCSNADSILEEGLNASRGTSLNNRGAFGVFTSTEPEGYIDSYGDCKIAINTTAMKARGDMPMVLKEPSVFTNLIAQMISSKYGIQVEREVSYSEGVDHSTWIIDSSVSPRYLSKLED